MMHRLLQGAILGVGLLPAFVLAEDGAQAAATQSISAAATRPSAAVTVPADFVGFGFETAFLNQYDNDFMHNLLGSVASRMSVPPVIRIGGTSGDRILFNPSLKANTSCISGDCPNGFGATFVLGPGYFKGFQAFQNSHMSFQVPLGRNVNATNVQDYAIRAYQALGANRVAAISIGNEVASANYEATAADYVADAKSVEQIVTEALNLTDGAQKIFEVLDLADNQATSKKPWTLNDAFNQGLNNNSLVKYAAEHWYQTDSPDNLQAQLLNHTAIVSKFRPYGQSLAYLQNHTPRVPYILSETGSVLGGTIPFAGHFGACLWSVDFQLFSMSQGVARVDGTGRPAANHSLFVPVAGIPGSPGPQVRGPYYAQLFAADFIGKTNGATGVANLDLKSDFLTAYAAYTADKKLARVALTNLHEWNASGGATRPAQAFAVKVPAGTASVRVGRLTAQAGAEAGGFDNNGQNITWAGQQWSYKVDDGKGHPNAASTETVAVANGVAVVSVKASEAVIVYIQ